MNGLCCAVLETKQNLWRPRYFKTTTRHRTAVSIVCYAKDLLLKFVKNSSKVMFLA